MNIYASTLKMKYYLTFRNHTRQRVALWLLLEEEKSCLYCLFACDFVLLIQIYQILQRVDNN